MIGMLRGRVWTTDADRIILDVNGVGYLLHVPARYLSNIKPGEEKVFYTHLLVREDDQTLVGFYDKEEKDLFLLLLGVNGIGPKAALAFLSAFVVQQLKTAIIQEDVSLLTTVPGVGGKIAKRLVLELKEKIKDMEADTGLIEPAVTTSGQRSETVDTLLALGFSKVEVRDALSKIEDKGIQSAEEQIKEALRLLAGSKDR